MPLIVGGSQRVVDFDGLTIDELAGNVATQSDRISIALVKVAKETSEPWLTLHYDEWMCVLKGKMVLLFVEGGAEKQLEVGAGQTVMINKGERFRPTFPEADTEYVPVCLPAFRPDRCIREEEGVSAVSANLKRLHERSTSTCTDATSETLYHMCQVKLWEAAKASGVAYFPPTFESDGNFTHATAVPSRLISTANHFYQDVEADWVCLQFTRSALKRHGIIVRDEEAMAVGDKPVGDIMSEWVCPHIIGGIPPAVVDKEFPMSREGKTYVSIVGLTDSDVAEPPFKCAR